MVIDMLGKLSTLLITLRAPTVVTVSAVSHPVTLLTAIMAAIFVKPHFWISL